MNEQEMTVTMPIAEYERLKEIERRFQQDIKMFERANVDGTAVMTLELENRILDIFC